ncbi:hypothetical protein EV421DRAFT_2018491 [Armillaria borealis]|uniref:Uncharacterized protein n=1 Tax=Armillaria borealis TaxID=47425 RepID=A0AA39MT09_9AGAR|nr:hypothetical protein EV421DRAFT_2018491 [Armillaria borealis]
MTVRRQGLRKGLAKKGSHPPIALVPVHHGPRPRQIRKNDADSSSSRKIGGLDIGQSRKCVAFCDAGSEEVHIVDEWDRTSSEPARSLSYQDMLELKVIQRTLPSTNKLPDMYTGKPASQFLSKVPIGLLPLLPTSSPPPPASPAYTRQSSEELTSYFPPSSPATNGAKKFAFLPLLETPPSRSPPTPPPTANTDHVPLFHLRIPTKELEDDNSAQQHEGRGLGDETQKFVAFDLLTGQACLGGVLSYASPLMRLEVKWRYEQIMPGRAQECSSIVPGRNQNHMSQFSPLPTKHE